MNSSNRPWRTLLRVEKVLPYTFLVSIVGWDCDDVVLIRKNLIEDETIRNSVVKGARLTAMVNQGAGEMSELTFSDVRIRD